MAEVAQLQPLPVRRTAVSLDDILTPSEEEAAEKYMNAHSSQRRRYSLGAGVSGGGGGGQGGPILTYSGGRRGSFFTQRSSLYPRGPDSKPFPLHLATFHRELKKVCRLSTRRHCFCPCAANVEHSTSDVEGSGAIGNIGLACLQALADEHNFEELQLLLFMKEIQRLNPNLREGCLFVDGLYELVCSRLPVQAGVERSMRSSARDLLTLNSADVLLLKKYWHKPQDADEHTAYLTTAISFVEFVLSKHGPQGVSEFLQRLDFTMDDPLDENFTFRNTDILKLEFKWKKFVEAEVNAKFRLSIPGMLRMLFTCYLVSYWCPLLIVMALMLVDIGMEFIYAMAFAQLLSIGFSNSTALFNIFQWTGALIATLLMRFVVLLLSSAVLVSVAVGVSSRLRRAVSSRLGSVTPQFLVDNSPSGLLTTYSQDISTIEVLVSNGLRAMTVAFLMVVTCFVFALTIVWPLGLALAGLFVVSQLFVSLISTRLSVYQFGRSQAVSRLCDILKEQIDGYLVNHIYQLSGMWEGQMKEAIKSYYIRKGKMALFFSNFMLFFQQMVPNISIATMLFGVVLLVRVGHTDFTTGMNIFIFYIRVSVALTAAASVFSELQTAATAMGRINAILHNTAHNIITTSPNTSKDGRSMGSVHNNQIPHTHDNLGDFQSLPVEFRGVCFTYKMSASHWNLFNVSLRFSAGERVAVVGTSGSGKSTLLMLAMGLYLPSVGEVVIGDVNTAQREKHYISSTFQSNHMFNTSLRENIRFGNLAASNEEVEIAARNADIHDWIMGLPRGYDTPVQSGGSSLSGGQRQRIAIARMLVAKTPVCLLDEVTSALDPVTGNRVFESLMEVTKGRTVLAVTHKLEYAKQFDRIVVLSHGRVKEVGSHSGLLAHRGTYWRMWNHKPTNSPGKPVSISRRWSLGELQSRDLSLSSELTILPLSSIKKPTLLPVPQPGAATPIFLPLHTLIETRETSNTLTSGGDTRGHTHTNSSAFTPQALGTCFIASPSATNSLSELGSPQPESCIPRKASTPKMTTDHHHHHQLDVSTKGQRSHLLPPSPLATHTNMEHETPLPPPPPPLPPRLTLPPPPPLLPPPPPPALGTMASPDLATVPDSKPHKLPPKPKAKSFTEKAQEERGQGNSNPPTPFPYDGNQTLPEPTSKILPFSLLAHHPTNTPGYVTMVTQQPLRSQLQRVLQNDSSVSLVARFDLNPPRDVGMQLSGSERKERGSEVHQTLEVLGERRQGDRKEAPLVVVQGDVGRSPVVIT